MSISQDYEECLAELNAAKIDSVNEITAKSFDALKEMATKLNVYNESDWDKAFQQYLPFFDLQTLELVKIGIEGSDDWIKSRYDMTKYRALVVKVILVNLGISILNKWGQIISDQLQVAFNSSRESLADMSTGQKMFTELHELLKKAERDVAAKIKEMEELTITLQNLINSAAALAKERKEAATATATATAKKKKKKDKKDKKSATGQAEAFRSTRNADGENGSDEDNSEDETEVSLLEKYYEQFSDGTPAMLGEEDEADSKITVEIFENIAAGKVKDLSTLKNSLEGTNRKIKAYRLAWVRSYLILRMQYPLVTEGDTTKVTYDGQFMENRTDIVLYEKMYVDLTVTMLQNWNNIYAYEKGWKAAEKWITKLQVTKATESSTLEGAEKERIDRQMSLVVSQASVLTKTFGYYKLKIGGARPFDIYIADAKRASWRTHGGYAAQAMGAERVLKIFKESFGDEKSEVDWRLYETTTDVDEKMQAALQMLQLGKNAQEKVAGPDYYSLQTRKSMKTFMQAEQAKRKRAASSITKDRSAASKRPKLTPGAVKVLKPRVDPEMKGALVKLAKSQKEGSIGPEYLYGLVNMSFVWEQLEQFNQCNMKTAIGEIKKQDVLKITEMDALEDLISVEAFSQENAEAAAAAKLWKSEKDENPYFPGVIIEPVGSATVYDHVQQISKLSRAFGWLRDQAYNLCFAKDIDPDTIPRELSNLVWKMFAIRNFIDGQMNLLSLACAKLEKRMSDDATRKHGRLKQAWTQTKIKPGKAQRDAFFTALAESVSASLSLWNAMACKHLYAKNTMGYLDGTSTSTDAMFPKFADPMDTSEIGEKQTFDYSGIPRTEAEMVAGEKVCRPMAAALRTYFMKPWTEEVDGSNAAPPTDLVEFEENEWSKEAKEIIGENNDLKRHFKEYQTNITKSETTFGKVGDDSFAHQSTTLSEIRLEALNLHMRCAQRLLNLV
jgi:hypothetical protein